MIIERINSLHNKIYKEYNINLNQYNKVVSIWVYIIAGKIIQEKSINDYVDFLDCFENGVVTKDVSTILKNNNIKIVEIRKNHKIDLCESEHFIAFSDYEIWHNDIRVSKFQEYRDSLLENLDLK